MQVGLVGVTAVTALLLGGLTSLGQTVLPYAVRPLANSASGWTLLTILVLWWMPTRTWVGLVLGVVCFVLLNVGYAVVSGALGVHYNPLLWSAVGIVVGPLVGRRSLGAAACGTAAGGSGLRFPGRAAPR
jgi:Family of unknown function (DUF6518)